MILFAHPAKRAAILGRPFLFLKGNIQHRTCSVENIVAGDAALFRHSPFTGANDEKVGLLGSLPGPSARAVTSRAFSPCAKSRQKVFSTKHIEHSTLNAQLKAAHASSLNVER
jgi:hypothetical protein